MFTKSTLRAVLAMTAVLLAGATSPALAIEPFRPVPILPPLPNPQPLPAPVPIPNPIPEPRPIPSVPRSASSVVEAETPMLTFNGTDGGCTRHGAIRKPVDPTTPPRRDPLA